MSALVSGARLPAAISLAAPVWRADQMGSYQAPVISSGYPALDHELPDGGWPAAALVELLQPQSGIGELQLLRPALQQIAGERRIALLQPPYLPQVAAWTGWGLRSDRLLWIRPQRSEDALWSAEQILRNGSCGALLFWQAQVRHEALRRLHLAAQGGDTAFWVMRPLAAGREPSPAPLRLALQAANGGIAIDIVKRRGPQHERPLHLDLAGLPAAPSYTATESRDAHLDRRPPAAAAARSAATALV